MSSVAPTASDPVVLLTRDGPVARITLNRPAQYNALSLAVLETLQASLDAVAEDDAVRVVVLAGSGPAFCAGHDLREMRRQHEKDRHRALFDACGDVMKAIVRLPQPVIARVHGIATAAGCQLVATCDLAVASSTARFAVSGVRLGLFCSTPGVALARNVPRKEAFRMLVTGEFVDGETAARLGLVNEVVEPDALDATIDGLCQSIASRPAVAVRAGKRLFYEQIERDLDGAYELAAEAMACNMMAPETVEGIDAFLEKRAPDW